MTTERKVMKPWRTARSESLIRDQWLSLRADTCELPSGAVISPYYVLEERDWVHVFAEDDQGRVLIVRQYRHGANSFCTELPGGVVDAGEALLDAAKRELLEETGYAAETWTAIGKTFANPARQTNCVHIFLARGLRAQSGQALDASEDIAFSFASVAEIKAMIARFEFSQSLHIASFYMVLEARVA